MNDELSVTLTLPAACKVWGVSETFGRNRARRGEFPGAFRIGNRWLVHRAVFLEGLEALARGNAVVTNADRIVERAFRDVALRRAQR